VRSPEKNGSQIRAAPSTMSSGAWKESLPTLVGLGEHGIRQRPSQLSSQKSSALPQPFTASSMQALQGSLMELPMQSLAAQELWHLSAQTQDLNAV
jgi:hypothetical protein